VASFIAGLYETPLRTETENARAAVSRRGAVVYALLKSDRGTRSRRALGALRLPTEIVA